MPITQIEWSWETIKVEFTKGADLTALQQEDLFHTFNEVHSRRCGRVDLEDVRKWDTRGSDSGSSWHRT